MTTLTLVLSTVFVFCTRFSLRSRQSVAQSEQAARQSAEAAGSVAVATATARLAKQAAEVADRVAGSGSRGSLSHVLSSTGPVSQETHAINQSNDALLVAPTSQSDSDHVDANRQVADHPLTSVDSQALATNLLLSRIEEMARRAHRAEAAAREAADALEAEQRFSRLYKDTCAENADQLKEVVSFSFIFSTHFVCNQFLVKPICRCQHHLTVGDYLSVVTDNGLHR